MKKRVSIIIYFISLTILITLSIQLYWNYKNFTNNKQLIINNIQTNLDQSIEQYYLEESKRDIINFMNNTKKLSISYNKLKLFNNKNTKITTFEIPKKNMDLNLQMLDQLSKKIMVSVFVENINLKSLNNLLKKSLIQEKINIPYAISHYRENKTISVFSENNNLKYENSIISKSQYLNEKSYIKLQFNNLNMQAYKASLISIIVSLFLCTIIIFCLIYLHNIINNQKKIAEIKNDFISNITHELKTPITIVSTAIEGIQYFNKINDIDKTNKYLTISNQELTKLNLIVEKILEMATLENKELKLKKELLNIGELISKCIFAFKGNTEKEIKLTINQTIILNLDAFHFENAIINLIDNAIKYGGEIVEIKLINKKEYIDIIIEDNGKGIPKNQYKKIFEKFYRIPIHNIHNVKGFGIGLYYVKQIIEKHNGTIEILPDETKMAVKISIPNV